MDLFAIRKTLETVGGLGWSDCIELFQEVERLKAADTSNIRCQARLIEERDKLKADLSYANYLLNENVEMIKLATGVISDSKQLREALEEIKHKHHPPGYKCRITEICDEALKHSIGG